MDKANYRDTLDALNALIDEQRKTNELLEKMVQPKELKTMDAQTAQPINKPTQKRGRKKQ